MAKRLKFNRAAFNALRTAPGVEADLTRRAEAIASAAGEGVEMLPAEAGRRRAHRVVATTTVEAAKKNEKENTLIRALDAGR